jgi:hypothetical protein
MTAKLIANIAIKGGLWRMSADSSMRGCSLGRRPRTALDVWKTVFKTVWSSQSFKPWGPSLAVVIGQGDHAHLPT